MGNGDEKKGLNRKWSDPILVKTGKRKLSEKQQKEVPLAQSMVVAMTKSWVSLSGNVWIEILKM